MRRTIVTLALAAAPAYAQHATVPPRPAPAPPQPFKAPRIHSHTLPNGLRLLVVEDHALQLVATRVILDADESDDPPGKEGLFAVTTGALREGTTSKSADQIAAASTAMGTAVSPTAFTTTTSQFAPALALLGDMLMHPSLDSASIEHRKALQAAAARAAAQRPVTPARSLFYALLYGRQSPNVRGLYASETSASAITRDDVVKFYSDYITPSSTTIAIAGDVTDADALATVTRVFDKWTGQRAAASSEVTSRLADAPTTIYLYDVPGTATNLFVGRLGPARPATNSYAADVMSTIVANRFVRTLREKRAFMYAGAVGTIWHAGDAPSVFVGSTVVSAAKADSALMEWLTMFRGFAGTATVAPAELETAKRARVGPLPMKIEGADSLAARLVEIARDKLPLDYLDRFAAGVNAVTAADVAAVTPKFLDLEHLAIVVTGDRKVLEPALRAANLAPVVVVNADGQRIP